MAGNQNSGRPGGNPDLKKGVKFDKYLYKVKGDKPLNKVVTLRMSDDLYASIRRSLPADDWQDDFRAKLEEIYGV